MRRREAGDEQINGYRIGEYPAEPYRGQENYRAPEYFVEVGEGIEDLPLSPHFTLGQFLCKQEVGEGPAYLVVSERLVLKLENILEAVNERGWRTDGFTVMSGYRTPAYNAGLGNGRNSRHIYGGAADIFIDTDGNGVMDDLNGDGVLDRQDAAVLYDLVEGMAASGNEDWQAGGLGEYGPNSHHGAFVHVDERGWRARWGRS
nr:D-Ala-D-Ala carboxypeptidase family metallohydrolase [Maricaulis parjimensis]